MHSKKDEHQTNRYKRDRSLVPTTVVNSQMHHEKVNDPMHNHHHHYDYYYHHYLYCYYLYYYCYDYYLCYSFLHLLVRTNAYQGFGYANQHVELGRAPFQRGTNLRVTEQRVQPSYSSSSSSSSRSNRSNSVGSNSNSRHCVVAPCRQ